MINNNKQYVIGVDGGATKTKAALANLKGRILKTGESNSSNLENVGIKIAIENIAKAIKRILPKKGEITSSFIGLPVIEERPKLKNKVKKELLHSRGISSIFKGKLKIGSDQIVAFRSGTDEQEGVLVIAGTGCVAHGWKEKKEFHTSGWGWLADEGSAFWVGQKVFQAVMKDLDKRSRKTLLKNLVFKKYKIKKIEDLIKIVYSKNPTEIIPQFSIICDEAIKKGDRVAKNIIEEAGKELALAAKTVIKDLGFQNKKFPLVLVGGLFKSKIFLDTLKKETKKYALKVNFIKPKAEPVTGAIKLAIEQLKD